jgi:hypothetical protein
MPTPTRNDAVTALVFVGVGAISLIFLAGAAAIAQRLLGHEDLDALIEGAAAVLVMIGGGSYGAYRYNQADKGGD